MTNISWTAPHGGATATGYPYLRRSRVTDLVDIFAVTNLVMALLFVSYFFQTMLAEGPSLASERAMEDRQSGNMIYQVMTFAIYGPAVLFLLARLGRIGVVLRNGWPYFLLIGLAMASVLWSVEPQVALRRAIALLLSAIYLLHVVTWFDMRRLLRIFSIFCAVLMIASLISVAIPGVGITPEGAGGHAGRLRGVLATKNYFGVLAGLSCLSFIVMYLTSPKGSRERLIWAGMGVLGFVELYFANSRTPLLGLIVAIAIMWSSVFLFAPTPRQRKLSLGLRGLIVGTGVTFTVVILPALVAVVLQLLGRDLTLSGRVKLWEYALEKGMDRFWFGAGYRTFWVDKLTFDLALRQRYWGVEGQATRLTSTGHNGFLDIWLELGMVGLVLMVLVFLMVLIRGNRFIRQTKDMTFLWHIGIFGYALVYYSANGFILKHDDVAWFAVAYACLSLAAVRVARPPQATRALQDSSRLGST